MLKFKRLNLCVYLPGLLFLPLMQLGATKESKAQNSFQSESYESLYLSVNFEDTIGVLKDTSYLATEIIDTNQILSAPVITLNPGGEKFIANYLKKNKEDLVSIKKRSVLYFKTIESILQNCKVPVELKYLAVIESELKTSAVSRVGAAGMWQFMPETARSLGLKVSGKTDERKQFTKSTKAAAVYIKSLYNQFDDWLLVVAAYNSGAGPVYKAIKKSGSRDFWKLQQFLPAETRAHVKRYIGAHYFFESKGSTATLTRMETIKHLKALADYNESMLVIEELKQAAGVVNGAVVQVNNVSVKFIETKK